jgi:hypothetical protein
MVEKTSTTTETGSVEDLEVLPPNPLEDAKTVTPNLEAQGTARCHDEAVRKKTLGHQEKGLRRR